MPAPSKILIKGSSIPGRVPDLSSLELRELAVNTADGTIFTKTVNSEIVTFLNSTTLKSLSAIWQNTYTTVAQHSAIWEGSNEDVSTLVKASSADWNIVGDRYFTTSSSTQSINKGTKVFGVSTGLSYIPTQDVTIVHDHDINHHMHGTVLDYNSFTGSLTADINSHTGTGTYSDWRINIGGTPTFINPLVVTTNSDVEVTDSSKGIILRSPNNSRWRVTISNNGTLQTAET